MRIHLVVNVSQVVQYKEQVERQKVEEAKLVEIEGVKEQEVDKTLNKKKVRGVVKYLAQWKRFTLEHDSQEREEDLENIKKIVVEFERRLSTEVRRQKRLDREKEKDFRRRKLLEKYMAKILYRQDNRNFKNEYLKKLERNW